MKKTYLILLTCLLFNSALLSMENRSPEEITSNQLLTLIQNHSSENQTCERITKEIEVGLESTIKCYVLRLSTRSDSQTPTIKDFIILPSRLYNEKSLSDIINILNHHIEPSKSSKKNRVRYMVTLPIPKEGGDVLGMMSKPDKLRKVSTFLEGELLPLVKKYAQAKLESKVSRKDALRAYEDGKESFLISGLHVTTIIFFGYITSLFALVVSNKFFINSYAETQESALLYGQLVMIGVVGLFYGISYLCVCSKKRRHRKLEAAAYPPKSEEIEMLKRKIIKVVKELDKMFVNREQGKITERITLAE